MSKALYIHIPFCHDICGYCDFVRVGYHSLLVDKYLIELRKDLLAINEPISSIYIGGGTPSALNLDQLHLLMDSLTHLINQNQEITIEVNPDSLTLEKAQLFVDYKINRVSLGVQSTHDEMLKAIGRTHSFNDVKLSLELLRSVGLSNISVDLMYGLPNQTLHDLNEDIIEILKLNPTHISLYSLTIEPNSQFGRLNIQEVESELETQMYLLIEDRLTEAGFDHYEISNYSLNDFKSKHNISYWHYDDFIGVGIGAAGKEGTHRYTNSKNINDYINGVRNRSESICLSDDDLLFEHLMMNLRLQEGIHIETFNERHNINLLEKYHEPISKHIKLETMKIENGFLFASKKGRLMLHDLLVDFM